MRFFWINAFLLQIGLEILFTALLGMEGNRPVIRIDFNVMLSVCGAPITFGDPYPFKCDWFHIGFSLDRQSRA